MECQQSPFLSGLPQRLTTVHAWSTQCVMRCKQNQMQLANHSLGASKQHRTQLASHSLRVRGPKVGKSHSCDGPLLPQSNHAAPRHKAVGGRKGGGGGVGGGRRGRVGQARAGQQSGEQHMAWFWRGPIGARGKGASELWRVQHEPSARQPCCSSRHHMLCDEEFYHSTGETFDLVPTPNTSARCSSYYHWPILRPGLKQSC